MHVEISISLIFIEVCIIIWMYTIFPLPQCQSTSGSVVRTLDYDCHSEHPDLISALDFNSLSFTNGSSTPKEKDQK